VSRLLGREKLVVQLEELLRGGSTVLLLGPLGIGKSAVLAAVAQRSRDHGRRCAFAPTTRHLSDVTAALAKAYPSVSDPALTQRRLRSRLRLAVEAHPGTLVLDHVAAAGTAMKGFLRSLRGTGLGVLLAADVENDRDHSASRALHLSHREVVLPPLPRSAMTAVLRSHLAGAVLPHPLQDDDRNGLLQLARGNPGRLLSLAQLLTDERYWRDGRVLRGALNGAALDLVLRHYLLPSGGR